jgi:large subunit ribosomal protein L9
MKEQLKLEVDSKDINMPDPIKSVGVYEVDIHLFKDVWATVKVEVERE